ncbi:MAG: hypothetical protein HRT51_01075 [Colwellia sp.]|nr:hypothetical protein [Colwellia sp.]
MAFNIPFTPTEITAFKDIALGISAIATGCAAVATATFAYRGLNKWQAETSFKAKFELAKEVVEVTYKISNTINRLRNTLYGLGGKTGIDSIRKTKLSDLINLHDHFQTLSVQVKALFNDQQFKLSNAVLMTSGSIISQVDDMLCYLEESYDLRKELCAREEDVANGHEVSKDLLDTLKADSNLCDEAFSDIFDKINITNHKIKFRGEEELTTLIETSIKEMVDSMDTYLKAK